jgi:YHS domain-containing protein
MEDLVSLLLFAGFFYLMMRFGCGAHMIHGHHSNESVDPVCGMKVSDDKGYSKVYQGIKYRFCSRNCLLKFDDTPEHYLNHEEERR